MEAIPGQIRIMTACLNANGESDLFFCIVACSELQIDNGDHYTAAERYALERGYEAPMVHFDELDAAGSAMLWMFAWDTASIVSDEKYFTHGLFKE